MSKLLNGIINYIGANGIFKNNDGDIPITSGNIILDNGRKLMSKNSQNVAKNIVGYNTDKVVFNYNGSGGTDVNAELFGNSITASAGGGVNINNTSDGTTDVILQSNARFTSTVGAATTTNNKITLSSDDGNVDIYTYRKIIRSGTTQTHENTYTFTPTGQLQGIQTPSSDTNAANKKYVDDHKPYMHASTTISNFNSVNATWVPAYDGFAVVIFRADSSTSTSSASIMDMSSQSAGRYVGIATQNSPLGYFTLSFPVKKGYTYKISGLSYATVDYAYVYYFRSDSD